jgi:uncharacterized protein involved in tolerance to divalent cations
MSDNIMVVTLINSPATGKHIAKTVVRERLAAAAHVIPRVTSFFYEQDTLRCNRDVMVLMRVSASEKAQLVARVKELHPNKYAEVSIVLAEHGTAK